MQRLIAYQGVGILEEAKETSDEEIQEDIAEFDGGLVSGPLGSMHRNNLTFGINRRESEETITTEAQSPTCA